MKNHKQNLRVVGINEIIVIRTCKVKGTKEEVSFKYAVDKLSGYWTDVQNLLINGEELFTPYASYQVKSEKCMDKSR